MVPNFILGSVQITTCLFLKDNRRIKYILSSSVGLLVFITNWNIYSLTQTKGKGIRSTKVTEKKCWWIPPQVSPPEAKKNAHFMEHDRTTEVDRMDKRKVSEERLIMKLLTSSRGQTQQQTLASSINCLIKLDHTLSLQFYLLLFYMQEHDM